MAAKVKPGLVAAILVLSQLEFFQFFGMVRGEISCPSYAEIPFCSCFVLDDQLHVQCSGNDLNTLQRSLTVLNGPVKSFSVYDLDSRVTVLPNGLTDNVTSPILQFSLSHSSLEALGDLSLAGLSKSLETLAIVSANLKFVPQNTLKTLKRLKVIDLEGNHIQELRSHTFNNVLLQNVNLKGNQLEKVSDDAFWGLEETLMEIDMSENKITAFPFIPFRNLRLLSQLNLAWNELSNLELEHHPSSPNNPRNQYETAEWLLLKQLNLNSNYLTTLGPASFARMGNLRSLSLHLNNIQSVHEDAFEGLTFLQSIDISHNKIKELGPGTFRSIPHILTIDLSNNHIHRIHENLFKNLTELKEILLNGNNLLQLSAGVFQGSNRVQVIYLQQNALRSVEAGILNPLRNLKEIRLSDNFLRVIPQDLFLYNEELTSLALDGNSLTKIVPGTFHNCKSLRELRLQKNKITTIPYGVLDVLPQLEEVYLENNQLSLVQGLDTLRTLRHISLSRNSLEILSAETLPGTEVSSLSLGYNQIKLIDDGAFINQSSLNILFLGNNQLTWLGQSTFQGLPNLERLYLQRNNVSDMHPEVFNAHLKLIQYIDLSFNYLKNVSSKLFSQLQFLEELNLASNQIATIEDGSFANLRSLKFLDLSSNKLSRIQYNLNFQLSGLETLKLCCNGLLELVRGGAQPIGLRELDLQDNFIMAENLRQLEMSRLEVLQLSGNNLTDLDENTFTGFPALSFLSIDNCSLNSLPGDLFRGSPNIAVLRASDNMLTYIPDNVFSPEVLSSNGDSERKQTISLPIRELHLRHNRLRNFPYKLLSSASQLQVLSLSGNKINILELSRIKLVRLKQFDMNDNKLSKITGTNLVKSFPILEVADFGENNISRLPDELFRNVSLTSLNFGGNTFTRIPRGISGSLMTLPYVLNMSGNPLLNFYTENPLVNFSVMDLSLTDTNVSFLSSDEFRNYPKLHRLIIKRNPIKIITPAAFRALVNLNLLDLSENDIESLEHGSFEGLSQLKSLNLSHNRIKTLGSIHPNSGGLQDLDLSFNQLSNLVPETLKHLSSLVSLRLRGNWITTLRGHLFEPLGRLSVLDLSHNFMETVEISVLIQLETRITSLRLEENPLSCDCDSREFWDWVFAHPKLFVSSLSGSGFPNLHCERPEQRRGRLILEADLSSICATPAILKLIIEDVRSSSAVVSWDGENNSKIEGYVVAYHALNRNDILRSRLLPPTARFHLLPDLNSDTPYLVCILAISTNHQAGNYTGFNAISTGSAAILLRDSPNSKCTQIRTLSENENDKVSILDRRLGVVVGAVVGIFVFIIFATTLLAVKLKKRTRFRQQQNGKIDNCGADILPETNNVGPVGGFHETHKNEHHAYVPHRNGNGVTAHARTSPDFLSYRHYSLATENGLHPSFTRTSELERL